MINRRKREFALRLKLKADTKAGKKRARIELDVVAMLEIAFSSARRRRRRRKKRRIFVSLQNRRDRKKKRNSASPSSIVIMLPFHCG